MKKSRYSPKQYAEQTDTFTRMRIDGATKAAIQAVVPTPSKESLRLEYQTKVLKKALDAQKSQATELLKLIETKGQVIDIKA